MQCSERSCYLRPCPPGGDHIERLRRMWELLLPAIVTDASLPYFREFLAREALRHIQPALSLE